MGDDNKDSALRSFVSGGFGGVCLVAVGHPFDLIKVRMQTQPWQDGKPKLYNSTLDCVKQTMTKEGPRGFYKGIAAPLAGITPIFAMCFWGYDMGQRLARSIWSTPAGEDLSLAQIGFAGAVSAVPTTLIMTPGERIKCILQIQGQGGQAAQFNSTSEVVKHVWQTGGLRNFYKGSAITLLRDGSGSVAYFGVYEGLKRAMVPDGGTVADVSPLGVFVAGGFAGICNWVVAIAPDTVKSRLQTAPEGTYSSAVDVFQRIVKEEGASALFKGTGPALLRAFPANAACFLGVEVAKKAWDVLF